MAEYKGNSHQHQVRYYKYIGLFIAAFMYIGLYAQPRLQVPNYYLGFHGGVSASSILFSPSVENMTPITDACVLGGNGGLVFRYEGHQFCGFQMELNYVHRGWAEKNDVGTYNRNLHYLELPILMHLNFGSDLCRWFFNLGPQIGYCVKDEGNNGTLVNGNESIEYQPVDHRFDWGLLVGTGIYFNTRKAGVYQLEIRYDFSFGGIYGTRVVDYFSMANPMDLSINLGWLMPIRHRKVSTNR